MPRTTDEKDSDSAVEAMRKSYSQFTTQIREGNSFSGQERNCAFLNMGDARFANVSSVSGLDFIDDARGLATSDWDRDGDVDLIFANRTAPQLRFMQNDYAGNHEFISLQLVGQSSNRDGIGAQVTIHLADGKTTTRTLRAGSGFLSQSSKRMTFGLGDNGQEKLTVQVSWPSGHVQTFPDVTPNQHYRLTEDKTELERLDSNPPSVQLAVQALPNAGIPGTVSAICYPRMKLPVTPVAFNNQPARPLQFTSRFTLINLWASWCNPCLAELKDFSSQYETLKQSGLEIVALSTDGSDGQSTSPSDAAKAADKLKLPFAWGSVDRQWLDKMTLLRGELFGLQQPFPMPTSILVDQKGDMRAFYLGVVSLEQLKQDLQTLDQPDAKIRDHLTHLKGQWIAVPQTSDNLKFAGVFEEHGYSADAAQYDQLAGSQKARQYYNAALTSMASNNFKTAEGELLEAIRLDDSFAPAHLVLANLMMKLAAGSQATAQTRALEIAKQEYLKTSVLDPENFDAQAGLGNVWFQQRQPTKAIEAFKTALQIKPDSWQVRVLLGRLLIAQKMNEQGVQQLEMAMKSAPNNGDVAAEYGLAMLNLGQYTQALEALRVAADAKPNDPRISRLLADSLMANGDFKTAQMRYRSALSNNPRDVDSMLRLAWIMATAPDASLRNPKLAVRYSQQAVSAGSADAAARQTLAAALAADGQFQPAIQQQSIAMQMLPRSSPQFRAATLRIERYRAEKDYQQNQTDRIPFFVK